MVRRQRTGIVAAPQGGARAEARLQALDLLAAAGLKRWGRWHRGDRRRGQRGDAALLGLAATGSLVGVGYGSEGTHAEERMDDEPVVIR
ncbi:hypothetical protein M0R45_026235 [Rubus argutus]|uniref:Uncharacterized protein n=1 Tax=Rubus argutus TaxID=59490 RepID=A0AAW1WXM1_RUBAR